MYSSVYLFKNKPTGPHEVDFVIGIGGTNYTISCPKGGGGRGVIRDYFKNLLQKLTSKRGVGGGGG